MALHAKILGKAHKEDLTPLPKFKGGELVKPADHCNNGTWEERINFASGFLHGEWWYSVDCDMYKGRTKQYAESTLQLVTKG